MNGNDAGNGHAPHLTATQPKGRAVGIGIIVKADKIHGFLDPILDFGLTEAEIPRTEGNVAGNRFFKELIFGVLKDHAHLMAHCQGFFRILPDIRTVDGNRAVRRLYESV